MQVYAFPPHSLLFCLHRRLSALEENLPGLFLDLKTCVYPTYPTPTSGPAWIAVDPYRSGVIPYGCTPGWLRPVLSYKEKAPRERRIPMDVQTTAGEPEPARGVGPTWLISQPTA